MLPRSLCSIALLLGGAVGCAKPPATLEITPEPAPATAAAPGEPARDGVGPAEPGVELACTAVLAESGEIQIAGVGTGMFVEEPEFLRMQVYPWNRRAILLAVGSQYPWFPITGPEAETLWRVRCDEPGLPEAIIEQSGADFSWSVLARDGSGIYFSFEGVQRLDFAAEDWGPIVRAPVIESCYLSEEPVTGDIYVREWVGEELAVHAGGPCGFEAEWLGGLEILGQLDGEAELRPASPVTTVAVDARGRLWAGNGGSCATGESVLTKGRPGLWRSDDGETWRFQAIPGLERGVASVRPAARGDRMLVHEECCYSEAADFCFGGSLWLSDDAGRSFRPLSPLPAGENPDEFGPVRSFDANEDLSHIELDRLGYTTNAQLHSDDAGTSWTRRATPRSDPWPDPSTTVEHRTHRYTTSLDGLRRGPTAHPTKVVLRP